jgi:hypothetical protein
MAYFFRKPKIEIQLENPYFRIGKSLTWAKLNISGFCLVRLSCPSIPDWKAINFLVFNSRDISKATPISATLVVQSWYLLGYFQREFKIADPDWILKTPAAQIFKNFDPILQNLIQNHSLDNIKSFSYKKSLFLNKLSKTIKKKRLINNPFSISSTVSQLRSSIYLKRVSVNPKVFYKEEALKDE